MGRVPMNKPDKVEGIVLISDQARRSLDDRQEVAYRSNREGLIKWLLGSERIL
jgi:hypothetical protein